MCTYIEKVAVIVTLSILAEERFFRKESSVWERQNCSVYKRLQLKLMWSFSTLKSSPITYIDIAFRENLFEAGMKTNENFSMQFQIEVGLIQLLDLADLLLLVILWFKQLTTIWEVNRVKFCSKLAVGACNAGINNKLTIVFRKQSVAFMYETFFNMWHMHYYWPIHKIYVKPSIRVHHR